MSGSPCCRGRPKLACPPTHASNKEEGEQTPVDPWSNYTSLGVCVAPSRQTNLAPRLAGPSATTHVPKPTSGGSYSC